MESVAGRARHLPEWQGLRRTFIATGWSAVYCR